MLIFIFILIAAYLIGAVPFGLLIGRAKGIDIREHGSKNIGATNVGRVLGRRWGWFCFALDMLKGAGPVLLGGLLLGTLNVQPSDMSQPEMWWWLGVAVAAILGHIFPVYLRFKGGKGVATGFGAMLAMWPLLTMPALVAVIIWYAVMRLTRYVSVASMTAGIALPLAQLVWIMLGDLEGVGEAVVHASPPLIVTGGMALLIIFMHRGNIARLRRGEESKVGESVRRGNGVQHDTRDNRT